MKTKIAADGAAPGGAGPAARVATVTVDVEDGVADGVADEASEAAVGPAAGTGGGGLGRGGGVNGDDPNRRPIDAMVRPAGFVPQGDERVDLTYWTCVTGKVPLKKQLKEYREALRKSFGYDPTADVPQYFGYKVERTEVDEDGKPGAWTPLKVRGKEFTSDNAGGRGRVIKKKFPFVYLNALKAMTFDWAVPEGMPPVVSPEYVHPTLTFPLPPVIGRDWAEDATHSDVPLFDPSQLMLQTGGDSDDEGDAGDDAPVDEDDPLAGDFGPDGMPGGPGGRVGGGGRGGIGRGPGMGGRGGYGGRGGLDGGRGPGMGRGGRGGYGDDDGMGRGGYGGRGGAFGGGEGGRGGYGGGEMGGRGGYGGYGGEMGGRGGYGGSG